ncbi:MAG: hypothetical protein WCO88_03665 [Actinomycetota bacterium]|jgi:putative membrane protein
MGDGQSDVGLLAGATATAAKEQAMWEHDHMGDGRWGVGWIGIIGMLLVVAATVGLIVWLVMRSPSAKAPAAPPPTQHHAPGSPQPHSTSAAAAREILDRRLATGEIDIDDYRARRAALDGHPPAASAPAVADPATKPDGGGAPYSGGDEPVS